MLLSLRPSLRPEQVRTILRSSALDSTPANGCAGCSVGRDSLSGWGRLDVAAALAALDGPLPLRDRYESNDDAGPRSYELFGVTRRIDATVDFWDDQDDVYAISLKKGQPVYVGLKGPEKGYDLSMALWLPHTRSIEDVGSVRMRVRVSARPGARQYFAYRAPEAGKYFVQVRMSSAGLARYRLIVVKA